MQPIVRRCELDPAGQFAAAYVGQVAQRAGGLRRYYATTFGDTLERRDLRLRRRFPCGLQQRGLIVVVTQRPCRLLGRFRQRSDGLCAANLFTRDAEITGSEAVARLRPTGRFLRKLPRNSLGFPFLLRQVRVFRNLLGALRDSQFGPVQVLGDRPQPCLDVVEVDDADRGLLAPEYRRASRRCLPAISR